MVFVAPKLTQDEAMTMLLAVWMAAKRKPKRFARIMRVLLHHNCFRLRDASPSVDKSRTFDTMIDDSVSRIRFRFTMSELRLLTIMLQLPTQGIVTPEGDRVSSLEALAMVCRRLSEASKLFTVANEFGRSTAAYSRVFKYTIGIICARHQNRLYFNYELISARIDMYCQAIHNHGAPLSTCWSFIDGTKQYISRPSARQKPASIHENLQRSVYNGHPRRHCFNWQGVQAPDGIIVSLYGPVEGRRHDSTMLNMSGIIDVMKNDQSNLFSGKFIYGDPAYGCSNFIICPSALGSKAATLFNRDMSSVRESVEWGFGRIKTLWEFMNWDKKQRARQSPVGKTFQVAVLLTNCHTCLQPLGNQISMYFGLKPPSLQEYLNHLCV
jgi:hypothetical protein